MFKLERVSKNECLTNVIVSRVLISVFASLLLSSDIQAQGTNSFQGVIVSANGVSFSIVDKSGNIATLSFGTSTSFINNKAPANPSEVIRFGMDVRGTLDPNGSVAQITTKGVATQLDLAQIPAFLGVSDEEWKILGPKIEKIQVLQRAIEGKANSGNGLSLTRPNPVQIALKDLQSSFFNQSPNLFRQLTSLREERAKTARDLAAARGELIQLLTERQETLLVIMGILE